MNIRETTMGAQALWVVDQRLTYHSASGAGRVLDGLKVSQEGYLAVDGEDDLPCLRFFQLTSESSVSPGGAPSAATKAAGRNNTPITDTLVASFLLSTSRSRGGYLQRDASDPKGFVEWASRVKDAVETPAFPNTVAIADCDDASYNGTYVYQNDRGTDIANPAADYGRWVLEGDPGDPTRYITWDSTPGRWDVKSPGSIEFIRLASLEAGPAGSYDADGSVIDPTGVTVTVDEAAQAYQPDAMLEHSLLRPVAFRMREWEVNQLAFTQLLEVILDCRPVCRGQRHFLVPASLTPYA